MSTTINVWDRIKPLTPTQEEIIKSLNSEEYEVLGIFGPTGTGKSLLTLAYGIQCVIDGKASRFIVSKPVVDVVTGEEVTLAKSPELFYDNMKSYVRDVIGLFIEWNLIEDLINQGKLVFTDARYLKGRTFDNAVLFLDDIQLMKPESILEAIVRVGRNTKLIVAGDPVFQALREVPPEADPAALIREVLMSEEKSKVIDLGVKDIVREGAKRGLRFLLEYKLRSRKLSEEEKKIYDVIKSKAPDADVISVVDLVDLKKQYEISSEHTPDALAIAKQGHLGRVVGKGGERIESAEKELNMKLRAVELSLDFTAWIRAIHPTSWIWKHIEEADFAGPYLQIKVYDDVVGAMVGQRGAYVRFLDAVFRKLLNVGVKVVAVERPKQRTGKHR